MAWDAQRQRVVLFGGGESNLFFSDTWEWNGLAWTKLEPRNSPPPRHYHAMAYDSARQRLVVFGGMNYGFNFSNAFADTWEFDGVTWTQRFPASSPPASASQQMAYDTARGRTVLLSNQTGQTWEWDGTSWLLRASGPSGLTSPAMAWDEVRSRVVLFGGSSVNQSFGDTWEWDGTAWAQRFPAVAPPARNSAAMAFDPARQRLVLFGGNASGGSQKLDDTWEWDGSNWMEQTPTGASPAARQQPAMAWDGTRGVMVLFGGSGTGAGNFSGFADTWERVGTSWVARGAPPPGRDSAMAFDGARQRMVVFGGRSAFASVPFPTSMPCLDETWEWDGTWVRRFPATAPSARCSVALTYDQTRARTLLFGGVDDAGTQLAETWEWDGIAWLQRAPTASPPARSAHAMSYDEARGKTVLFGGWNGTTELADVWEWDGTDWRERLPPSSPPAQQRHSMTYDASRGLVVVAGSNGTWEWDGTTWRGGVACPRDGAHAIAWDPLRQRTVAYVWAGNGYVRETWEWDGMAWLQRPLAPAGPFHGAMAWDGLSQRMMLFNGDTWFIEP